MGPTTSGVLIPVRPPVFLVIVIVTAMSRDNGDPKFAIVLRVSLASFRFIVFFGSNCLALFQLRLRYLAMLIGPSVVRFGKALPECGRGFVC